MSAPGVKAPALVFVGASTLLSLIYGWWFRDWALHAAPDAARVVLKTAPVAILAALALRRAPRLLAAALSLGALGDALLAITGTLPYVAGAVAFFAGHICYVILFLRAGAGLSAALRQPERAGAMIAVLVISAASAFWLWPRDGTVIAIALYTVALTAMALSAFTLPRSAWLAMMGGVLFLLSDVLLSWGADMQPGAHAAFVNDASWFTYWLGQLGLCLGGLALQNKSLT